MVDGCPGYNITRPAVGVTEAVPGFWKGWNMHMAALSYALGSTPNAGSSCRQKNYHSSIAFC